MKYTIKFTDRKVGKKLYDQVYRAIQLVLDFIRDESVLTDGPGRAYTLYVDCDELDFDIDHLVDELNVIFGVNLTHFEEDEDEED